MQLTDKILAPRVAERNSKFGKLLWEKGVPKTRSLDRIVALPRRTWGEDLAYAKALSRHLSPAGGMTLRPFQAVALTEVHDYGGAFISGRVGIGKTLISFLAPSLLGAERPVLLIPAKLRGKTAREFELLRLDWPSGPTGLSLSILSYEQLGRVAAAEYLDELQPDLIIADECHRLKNTSAAVTRRVRRYMKANPETAFVAMSGTVTKRSLGDFGHLLAWTRGEGSPLPTEGHELSQWSLAVDEKLPPNKMRLRAGALEELMNADERQADDPVDAVRRAVRRRIHESPGCVMTSDEFLGASLALRASLPPDGPPPIEEAFRRLRGDWETPDGVPFGDAIALWRHARELALGFYYRWDPQPPEEWLEARRAWARVCRHLIEVNRQGIDSELALARAISGGAYAGHRCTLGGMADERTADERWSDWAEVRDTFKLKTVPVWLSSWALEHVEAWAAKSSTPSIIWVGHTAFGEELDRHRGIPYFGAQGKDRRGRVLEDMAGRTVAASIAANAEGRNLQAWSRQLVTAPPSDGSRWEQLLGRTHRDGQAADEVTCDVLLACSEHWDSWEQARADAAYLEATTGQPQKILRCDDTVEEPDFPGSLSK